MRLSPVPATILLGGVAAAALLATELAALGIVVAALVAVCLRAPAQRRRPYLLGALVTGGGIALLSPFLAVVGYDVLWSGPVLPVLGSLDVTTEELLLAAQNGLRLSAVALAFGAYALLVDHDRLVAAAARIAPRSSIAVALATRLVPSLERDAGGLRDAVRGRGVVVTGARGHARLLSPLVAGSLERALNLAEAMEARGFGRLDRTSAPGFPWTRRDRLAVAAAPAVALAGALWL